MYHLKLCVAFMLLSSTVFAQKAVVKWGEEFKLERGSTDLHVVMTDKTGVYLEQGHLEFSTYHILSISYESSATLVKLDPMLKEKFQKNYSDALGDRQSLEFFVLKDRLFLFAFQNFKKELTVTISGVEINKENGELIGNWVDMATLSRVDKKENIQFKLFPNADSTNIVMISSALGTERNEYRVQTFDVGLHAVSKAFRISNEFDWNTYKLEEILYTVDKRVILAGRVYTYEEGAKKKEKNLAFKSYSIRIYDETGKQQAEINTAVNGKWLTSTQLLLDKGKDLVLLGFYGNSPKSKTIDGLLVQRINPLTGEVLQTNEKVFKGSELSAEGSGGDEADEEETKEERREREELEKQMAEGSYSRYMKFRNVYHTTDGGLLILAEKYNRIYKTTTDNSTGAGGNYRGPRTTYYLIYECGDLMAIKLDAKGGFVWMQVVPKFQRETFLFNTFNGAGVPREQAEAVNRPFFASFGAIQTPTAIHIFMNDSPRNLDVVSAGQRYKSVYKFSKTDLFELTINEATGKITRKSLCSNADIPTSMPRLGSAIGTNWYLVGKTDRIFKSKLIVGMIGVK